MRSEHFQWIAYFDVHEYVINDSEEIYYFSQSQNEVIIESKRNKCIFRKHDELYKLQYLESDGLVWIMHEDQNQIFFNKKIGKYLYFTHINHDHYQLVDVVVVTG